MNEREKNQLIYFGAMCLLISFTVVGTILAFYPHAFDWAPFVK